MNFDLLGIFGAGLLTFVSPCILPLVPVYLGLLGGASVGELKAGNRVGRTVASAVAFALGLSAVFVALGLAATAAGRALIAHRQLLLQLGGLMVFLFGLKFLGVLHVPWLEREVRPGLGRASQAGVLRGLVMGAAFGLGWTPCIGPVLGSVLTVAASSATTPLQGAAYLAAYAAGLSLPLIVVAAFAPVALGLVKRVQRHMPAMQKATGALLAAVGLLLLTDNLGFLTPSVESPLVAQEGAPSGKTPGGSLARAQEPFPGEAAACEASTPGAVACGLPAEAPAGQRQALPPGPAMVEFVSNSCPICLRMAPVVAAAERDCSGMSVEVRKIYVDAPGGLELARQYGVMGVPTFLFVDASGREVARLVGEQPLATLEQSLQVLTGERCDGFRKFPAPEGKSVPGAGAPSS